MVNPIEVIYVCGKCKAHHSDKGDALRCCELDPLGDHI